MKVCQVIDELRVGGAEKLLVEMAPLLAKKGIGVNVVVLTDKEAQLIDILKKYGIRIHILGHGSTYSPLLLYKLTRHFLKNQFDIIHVHLFPAQFFAVVAKFLSGTKAKIITTEHSPDNNRRRIPFVSILDNWTYRHYDKVISISQDSDKRLKENVRLPDKRFCVIENGINLTSIECAQPVEDFPHPSILMCAGFKAPKDQLTVIKSLEFLPNSFKVVFAGGFGNPVEHERMNECIKEAKRFGERVIFLGVRNDIPQLVKSADYHVLSSGYEGVSLSAVEAMASGKPFIASDVHGLHEQVGGFAELFPLGDAEALAQIIMKLEHDKEHKKKVIERCLARAREFDIHTMVDKYVALYRTL
jgi:glycosyltransferase involved in cell wall biosynthesis